MSITHSFISAVAEQSPSSGLIGPNEWNAVHTIGSGAIQSGMIGSYAVNNVNVASGMAVLKLSATGTPSATTYLRGDASWATPTVTSGSFAWSNIINPKPMVTVTANGGPGGDGGDYGPNTSGTSTAGVQEAINYVQGLSTGGMVMVMCPTTAAVTISYPYVVLRGIGPAGTNIFNYSQWAASKVASVTLDSTSRSLTGVEVGYLMLEKIEFTGVNNASTGIYVHDCDVNVNSTSNGVFFDSGSSYVSNSVFERCWFDLNASSSAAFNIVNGNTGFGQIQVIACSFSLSATNVVALNMASGAYIGTNMTFTHNSFYQGPSASGTVLFNVQGVVWGLEVSENWVEPHASMTAFRIAPAGANVKHVHLNCINNSFGGSSQYLTIVNNTNTAWYGEESNLVFAYNNFTTASGSSASLGTAGDQSDIWRVIIRHNPSLFPATTVLSNYVDSSNDVFGLFGTGTSIPASTDLLVCGDLVVTLSSTANIVIKDKSKTQINGTESSLNMRFIPDGCFINFGTGTVTVTAVNVVD